MIYLFDHNGTLVNDDYAWRQSVVSVFKPFDIQPPSIAEHFTELDKSDGDYIGIYKSRGVPLTRDQINERYSATYQSMFDQVELQAHTSETLRTLQARRGTVMGLLTASPEPMVHPVLRKFDLLRFFKYLYFHSTDKQAVIRQILENESTNPEDCCLVGDSPSDTRHANKAGVASVAFLNGLVPEELVLAAKPRFVIRSFRELLHIKFK